MKRHYNALMPFYALALLYMMFYGCGREAAEIGNLQLKPFHTIHYIFSKPVPFEFFFVNIICNIAVFVPFGLVGLIFKPMLSIKNLLPFYIFGISCVEFIQYLSGRGTADVDDVILNTLGMLSGFIFFKAYQQRTQKSLQSISA